MWLDERGREIVDIPQDGLCYFRALQNSLGVQYSQKYTLKEIEEKIIEEISHRPKFYLTFYPQVTKKEALLADVHKFFKEKFFACDTVDMLIGTACNAFDITLWIYQQDQEENMHSIQYSTGQEAQTRCHCHLILYRDRNDIQGLGSHYNSIVSKKKNKGNIYEDYGADMYHVSSLEKV